jgi:DNA polymerase III delta subunit
MGTVNLEAAWDNLLDALSDGKISHLIGEVETLKTEKEAAVTEKDTLTSYLTLTVNNLYLSGYNSATISKITGLPIEKIAEIVKPNLPTD